MKKFTLFFMSLFLAVGAMAEVDYTPNHTGRKSTTGRLVGSISVGNVTYTMPSGTRNSYTDLTSTKTFTVEAGATVTLGMTQSAGSWMNAFVYVDMDNNGFTAGIASDNYTPTGDLVSYSFYNQGYSDDENGRNSAGNSITGNNRSTLALPSWTVPENLAPGEYRIRFKYDWCNINPAGDTGTYFKNTFTGHGGEIIDAKLVVLDKSELQALIAEAEELLSKVSEAQKTVGEELDITGKISSNAAQNPGDGNTGGSKDGAGIAGLVDNDPETYFHSRWGGTTVNADHYLQIDLGENGKLSDFCFEYATRKTNDANATSPAPLAIEVRVSANGSNFGEPIVTFTKDRDGLPTHADLGQTLWRSDVISATEDIRYIRLTVTDSKGPGNDTWNNHHFFAMGTLNIYPASTTYSVKEGYSNVITVENVEAAVAALAAAVNANNSTITLDELNNATNNLNAALNALRVVYTHTLNVTDAGWATLYLGFPAKIPAFDGDDAGAYIVTGVKDGDWLNLEKVEVEKVLPANTGIIVKANKGDYTFAYSSDEAVNVKENLLKGTIATISVEGEAYVLGYAEGTTKVVFGKAKMNGTSWVNNAYKAYLPVTALPTGANAAYYSFRFGEGTTGIDEVKGESGSVKGEIYDLTGRRIEAITASGIYIVNGRKVLVK